MDEANFTVICDATLQNMFDQLDEAFGDRFEIDMENGVITICFGDEEQIVINRHGPMRQIWMASPISGGSHFNYNEATGQWHSSRDDSLTLRVLLASELSQISGDHFHFD